MQSVNELCEKGNSLSEVGMYQEALSCFKHALEKTPETYDYEDERVWILVAIGDTLSSIACGYYNNFQIEYKCILVHLKRLIPYAFSFSSKSTETLLSELQKAAKGNAVAQAILRYQQDNSFKCKSDSDQISIQKFFPTCGLMDEYFRWLLL